MLSFSAIHILLVIIAIICGLYSIREYRYTYKRLTGMIYVLNGRHRRATDLIPSTVRCVSAASLLVCLEVLSTIFRHASEHLPSVYPAGTEHKYGVCYVLGWIIFAQHIGSAVVFFICGKKRKGTFDEATEEEALANLPVDLGRL